MLRTIIVSTFPAVTAAAILFMFWWYRRDVQERRGRSAPFGADGAAFRLPRHAVRRRDVAIMLLVTAVYAVVAFAGLGDNAAPQTFYKFTDYDRIQITFDQPVDISRIMVYTGGTHSKDGYTLTYQDANGHHHDWDKGIEQGHGDVFHWFEYTPPTNGEQGYTTALSIDFMDKSKSLELGEIAAFDRNGALINPSRITVTAHENETGRRDRDTSAAEHTLFDEQDVVPDYPSYMNSMYFDEIYHVRTAREYLCTNGVYETTHPPLGKLIISLSIWLLGLTPLAWRLPGVITGILMVPLCYLFVKRMFGKTWLAAFATLWFSFDFMHFVQTRIATIDSYAVLFTMAMFYFMYEFISLGFETPLRKRIPSLLLCGLSFGLGIAAKWTCWYAGAGICLLYIIHLIASRNAAKYWGKTIPILLLSVVFFLIIPTVIYYFSYLPFAYAQNKPLTFELVWANQELMFGYHSSLTEPHVYQSSWYQWLINARPILYYLDDHNGLRSAFSAFLNPVVCWGGLCAVVALFGSLYRKTGRFVKRASILLLIVAIGISVPLILFDQAASVELSKLPEWVRPWANAPEGAFMRLALTFCAAILLILALPSAAQRFTSRRRAAAPPPAADTLSEPNTRVANDTQCVSTTGGGAAHGPTAVSQTSRSVALFILVGFLAQLLPWVLVSRATFNYHYFQCLPFLVLAIAAVFDRWHESSRRAMPLRATRRAPSRYATASTAQRAALWFTVATLAMFALFYPALSGVYVPQWYSAYLTRWFFSWVA